MKNILFQSTTTAHDLVAAAKEVKPASEPRSRLPILGNVLVQGIDDALILTCTSLEDAKRRAIPAATTGGGAVAVPARLLLRIAEGLCGTPRICGIDAPVTLRAVDDFDEGAKNPAHNCQLVIECGDCRYNLHAIAGDEFPVVDRFFDGPPTVVAAEAPRKARRTAARPTPSPRAPHIRVSEAVVNAAPSRGGCPRVSF
jgi:hypothetical protein